MNASASTKPSIESAPHPATTPIRIKTILAAVDFSPQSMTAARYAVNLARQLSSRLTLLHAATYGPYIYPPTGIPVDIAGPALEWGRKKMSEFVAGSPELGEIEHEEVVVSGVAAPTIDEAADNRGADLVVMGSHGRSGISKLAFGSVAEEIVRLQHRPILVVGPQCNGHFTRVKSILLAVSLPTTSRRAAQYAASIAHQSQAGLTAVHVAPDRSRGWSEDELRRHLDALIPDDPELANIASCRVLYGDVAEQVLRAAFDHHADLIVIGAKNQSVLADHAPWAILSRIIRDARCPVLAVPSRLA